MRAQLLPWSLLLGVGVALLGACGGSASETPPPLEPVFTPPVARAIPSALPARAPEELPVIDDAPPALPTWGRTTPRRPALAAPTGD